MLDLQIKAHEVDLTPEVEQLISERAERLAAFYDRIHSAKLVLEGPTGHHRKGGPFDVRIDLNVPGATIAVTKQRADDLRVAVRSAFEAAGRQLEDYVRKQRPDLVPPVAPPRARIVRMFPEEGYGFLQAEDGHEVYFHQNSVLAGAWNTLEVGMEVRYAEEPGEKGPQASSVAP